MATNKFGVIVQHQGKDPKLAMVQGGATVATALEAAGFNPESYKGRVTLQGKRADLSDRLKTGQLVGISEQVAGGR
jgi:hypothetical protein